MVFMISTSNNQSNGRQLDRHSAEKKVQIFCCEPLLWGLSQIGCRRTNRRILIWRIAGAYVVRRYLAVWPSPGHFSETLAEPARFAASCRAFVARGGLVQFFAT